MQGRKKVVLIGIDALMGSFVERFAAEGKLPHINRLIREGTYTEVLPFPPTLTSTNWATIATGAEPAVHGVTDFYAYHPGDPLDGLRSGFSSEYCKAELIWQTAEKAGLKSIVVDYPHSWPVNLRNGIHVGEAGFPVVSYLQISFCSLYATQPYEGANLIKFHPAVIESPGGPADLPVLETTIALFSAKPPSARALLDHPAKEEKIKSLRLVLTASTGNGYDRLVVAEETGEKIASLGPGQWSDWVTSEFVVNGKVRRGIFRMKLVELSSDGTRFRLYFTQIYPDQGFTDPPQIASELIQACGPYLPHAFHMAPVVKGWYDAATHMEENDYQAKWYAGATAYLMRKYPWDLVVLKWHSPDQVKHAYWGKIDPLSPAYDPAQADYYWGVIRQNYQMVDDMVGELKAAAGEEAVVILVSDHGHIAHVNTVHMNTALERAGLLAFRPDGRGIDWTRTRAYAQRIVHVYVNLKGRSPGGIVSPGAEYESVRREVISTLLNLKDPESGECPVTLALTNEDALSIGTGGEWAGDVIYMMKPGYSNVTNNVRTSAVIEKNTTHTYTAWGVSESHHGPYLANTAYSIGSIKGIFAVGGPGIKRGYRRNQFWLRDVAPTVAHILGIPAPAQSQGAVLQDIFA